MTIEVLIIDLNMDAVNTLIWCLAVVAKMGIVTTLIVGTITVFLFFASLLDW